MRHVAFTILAVLGLALFQVSCTSLAEADTGRAGLYVFDQTSRGILAWDDVATLYDASAAGSASRTITGATPSDFELGWGGMAFDSHGRNLYLVSTSGTLVKIGRIDDQSGAVDDADLTTVTLDDSGTDAEDGTLGQASVDSTGSHLYITECLSGGKSQIWVIATSCLSTDGGTLTKSSSGVAVIGNTTVSGGTNDKQGFGVACGADSAVYGYFGSGGTVTLGSEDYTASARLRRGIQTGFTPDANVILGKSDSSATLLGNYGCLAYDTGNDRVYLARQANASPLLAFEPGDFNPGGEVPPETTFDGPADLRVIAHGGAKDWLVGAGSGDNKSTLWIWKAPSVGDTHRSLPLSSSVVIRGLALDGSD
ncbi:MAG TPA: hypothetical protein PLA48_04425 [Holophaga sp.]|nr:hypothetical protein [Holophaga sp.]